jgi:hypothetical protein
VEDSHQNWREKVGRTPKHNEEHATDVCEQLTRQTLNNTLELVHGFKWEWLRPECFHKDENYATLAKSSQGYLQESRRQADSLRI